MDIIIHAKSALNIPNILILIAVFLYPTYMFIWGGGGLYNHKWLKNNKIYMAMISHITVLGIKG